MSNKDLHMFLAQLEQESPGSVIRIDKEVSPEYEIPVILNKIELKRKQPVLIFSKVRNLKGQLSPLPVVINLFGARERLAKSIDSTVERLPLDYIAREKKPVAPVVIDKKSAKVKDIVQTGDAVDLFDLPVITHHEMDLGAYLTSPSIWIRDRETGRTNCAIMRVWVCGPRDLVVHFNPVRHTEDLYQQYKKAGLPIPVVIVMGHHPSFYLGAQTKLLVDEVEVIGGVMGEPLEVTPSETWGDKVMVPAQADLVIEAEMLTDRLSIEAPFGEYAQYYAGQRLNPPLQVKAVTRRKDAYYLDIMPGHADHLLLDAPMIEAYLYNRIRDVVPGIIEVHVPLSSAARLHAYIKMRKRNDGEPKTAILAALSSDYRIKHVIVVDDDVDIHYDEQVLWAVATRSQWDRDVIIVPGTMGTRVDPTAVGVISAKGGIDATKPMVGDFPKKINLPNAVVERIKLENYLKPADLRVLE
jgi:2,5-furandicarboxylate decarboxylase 1